MTGTGTERFAMWLSSCIRPALSEHGFSKERSTFHRRGPAGWGVVNVQKSQFGSRLQVRFTINVGVALDRLAVARGDDPGRRPPEHRCAWRCRIGTLMGDPGDRWWQVDGETDLPELTTEVLRAIIERGIPFIDVRLTDDGFVAALAARPRVGHIAGFTETQVIDILGGPR